MHKNTQGKIWNILIGAIFKYGVTSNFPPKQIGPIMSECLVTGLHRPDGSVVLSTVDMELPNGARLA